MKRFKVLMVGSTNAGTMYHRMYKFAKYMRFDIDTTLLNYNPDSTNDTVWEQLIKIDSELRERLYDAAKEADIIIFQALNTIISASLVKVFKDALNVPVVMEIDDYIFNIPTYNAAAESYKPDSNRLKIQKQQLQESDAVIVSTEYLKEVYKPFNKNIHIIPNGIDFNNWGERKNNHKKVRVGWIGSATHVEDLIEIREPLKKMLKIPNVEFVCVGGVPNFVKNWNKTKYDKRWVSADTYPNWLAQKDFDIGLFPLIDNHFNRGKSALRYYEYSALKIPTIASDVLPCRTIKDGKTGLISRNADEWYDNMKFLIGNKKRREIMGRNAYRQVKKYNNAETIAKKYLKILRGLV